MKKRYTGFQLGILLVTILYVIAFGVYYLIVKNYEFLWYVLVMFFLIALVIFLHLRFRLSTAVMAGASIWGLMHMLGGSIYINGTKLYAYMLVNIYNSGIDEFVLFKYDQLAHFYCYVIVTLIVFYVLKNYLKKEANWPAISVLLVFIGMGIGALNEIIEFIPLIIFKDTGVGGYYNTLLDIVFNTLGSIVAVIILSFKKNKIN
jgi:uncharacterized membrane protein YjdF